MKERKLLTFLIIFLYRCLHLRQLLSNACSQCMLINKIKLSTASETYVATKHELLAVEADRPTGLEVTVLEKCKDYHVEEQQNKVFLHGSTININFDITLRVMLRRWWKAIWSMGTANASGTHYCALRSSSRLLIGFFLS